MALQKKQKKKKDWTNVQFTQRRIRPVFSLLIFPFKGAKKNKEKCRKSLRVYGLPIL